MRRLLAVALTLAMLGAAPLTTRGGFTNADRPWHFVFPRDHAAHPAFASEWWYYTGHLRTRTGRRFGFELTFFRIGLRPGDPKPSATQSRWRGNQLFPAHFAISDDENDRFVYHERFAREALGMGSAATHELSVHVLDWSLEGTAPMRLRAREGSDALALDLTALKPPAIHGHDGISKKAPCATCASHYYSLTRMQARGTLATGGRRFDVDGQAWMDHEFGSDELQSDLAGWDWFALQLDDGRELMLYRLRRKDGTLTAESSGSLVERDGRVRYLPRDAVRIDALGSWRSPHTGATYPSGWHIALPSGRLDVTVKPLIADQELAAPESVSYWEGDCDVRDAATGARRGSAYVELTGYAGAISL